MILWNCYYVIFTNNKLYQESQSFLSHLRQFHNLVMIYYAANEPENSRVAESKLIVWCAEFCSYHGLFSYYNVSVLKKRKQRYSLYIKI